MGIRHSCAESKAVDEIDAPPPLASIFSPSSIRKRANSGEKAPQKAPPSIFSPSRSASPRRKKADIEEETLIELRRKGSSVADRMKQYQKSLATDKEKPNRKVRRSDYGADELDTSMVRKSSRVEEVKKIIGSDLEMAMTANTRVATGNAARAMPERLTVKLLLRQEEASQQTITFFLSAANEKDIDGGNSMSRQDGPRTLKYAQDKLSHVPSQRKLSCSSAAVVESISMNILTDENGLLHKILKGGEMSEAPVQGLGEGQTTTLSSHHWHAEMGIKLDFSLVLAFTQGKVEMQEATIVIQAAHAEVESSRSKSQSNQTNQRLSQQHKTSSAP